jgi:hypothetical protein
MKQIIDEKTLANSVKETAQIQLDNENATQLTDILLTHAHGQGIRGALAVHGDEIIHFDIFKAVTSVALVVGNVMKAVTDPTFVSWTCVIAGLAQLRGITTRISPYAITICVLLFDQKLRSRPDLFNDFIAAREQSFRSTVGEREFSGALSELIQLGCVRLAQDDWIELKERVVVRV